MIASQVEELLNALSYLYVCMSLYVLFSAIAAIADSHVSSQVLD